VTVYLLANFRRYEPAQQETDRQGCEQPRLRPAQRWRGAVGKNRKAVIQRSIADDLREPEEPDDSSGRKRAVTQYVEIDDGGRP